MKTLHFEIHSSNYLEQAKQARDQNNLRPTPADIVQRFGLNSSTFISATCILREALKIFGASEAGILGVKRQQWAFHLARVYGSADISNDEMFIRHTYLCQFAKLLAYTACFGVEEAMQKIEGIIDGRAFEILGVSNIGEQDFFAWVLAPEVHTLSLEIFKHIAASLVVYDLSNIEEDLLKQLYQNLVEPETRHESGEFYTPDWLAELTLREIGYRPGQSLLDPSCGSGTFLFTAIRCLMAQGVTGQELVDFVFENIMGMDMHPLAVIIAKINYVLAILPHMQDGTRLRQQYTIPIILANALQVPNRQFDVIVGNPPWIAYRYLQDRTYQIEIKKLARDYELLAPAWDTKLHTQMELATLFFEHCSQVYLKTEGIIAFVMPRSVITGAKQHSAFQQRGFSQVLDLKGVVPLFNVETCVMLREHSHIYTKAIPTIRFDGKLPAHECRWEEASVMLTRTETITDFVRQQAIASPYYHPKMINGANLYPRTLAFVTSAQRDRQKGHIAYSSYRCTDPDVVNEAKLPWRDLKLEGHIDEDFLYATLLSKHLVPFGVGKLHLVALSVKVAKPRQRTTLPNEVEEEHFTPILLEEIRNTLTLARSGNDWFEYTEEVWQKHKKLTTKETLPQWFNYQNKVTAQIAAPGYLALYGAAGSNLAASVLDTHSLPVINGAQPRAFVADHTTYWYRSSTEAEAHFLVALLNAPCVDAAIKGYQTRGLFGARHIHRRPFEVCAIPRFNQDNPDHQQLVLLSQAAHKVVATLDLAESKVVAARKRARQATSDCIIQIDAIAQRILGLSSVEAFVQEWAPQSGS